MTVVSIAHRLSSIRNAQYIAVLHEGVVVEYGTHEQLMQKETGEYRARYELYFSKNQNQTFDMNAWLYFCITLADSIVL